MSRGPFDFHAALVAGFVAGAYRLLRVAAPDASPLLATRSDILDGILAFAVPIAIIAALAGWLVAWTAGKVERAAETQSALRPLWWGAMVVLAALPLRLLVFHDPAPVLLVAGLAVGGLAAAWRLLAVIDLERSGLVAAAVALLVGLSLLPSWPAPQGDEPHYLIVAHSLVEDGDLDVADDYADGVFAGYHPDFLSPHYKLGIREGSRYSMHGAGYPLFLAPAYALGRLISPRMSVTLPRLQQVLLHALFAWILVQIIVRHLGAACALRGTIPFVILAPVLFAPLHLFPETPAMTLSAGAFWLLTRGGGRRDWVGAGLCLALLPWLGVKYIPIMLTVGATGAVLGGASVVRLAAVCLPVALSCLGHTGFTWALYGSLSPSAVYLGADPSFGRQPGYGGDWWAYVADWRGALSTAVGYFLDQKEGLFAVAPQFLMVAAGAVLVWRRNWQLAIALVVIVASHLAPYALSQQLGGQSPPARPMLAIAWALAIPLAAGLSVELRPIMASLRAALVTLGAAITVYLVWDPSLLPHDYGVRASWLLRATSPQGWEIWRWFPSWVNVSARPVGVNLVWLLAAAAVAAILVRGMWPRQLPERRSAPFQPAWAAATFTGALLTILALAVAMSPLTDRHQGGEISPGVQAWTIAARPAGAWQESGGVWGRPGPRRNIVLTTAEPIVHAAITARSLVQTDIDLAVGDWRTARTLVPTTGLDESIEPGVGRRWRNLRVYRAWAWAERGATPAGLDGGDDWRELGVFISLRRGDDGDR